MTNSATKPLLELVNVSKSFGGTKALNNVSWSVGPGEIHCLVGENGSGKSTMIKLISGVHTMDPGGEIRIDGHPYTKLTPHQSKDLGLQVIYQDLSLFPNLTVSENISIDQLLGNSLSLVPHKQMRLKAAEILAELDHQLPLDAIVGTLSVAQRQIVAICRGLAANARLLFMDEPTASLTRHEVDRLFTLVRRLQSMSVAVVFVSHRMDEIIEIAERVSVLRDGSLVGTYLAADITDHDLAEFMTGDRIVQEISARDQRNAKPLLQIRGAEVEGDFAGVDLTLHEGEILGITGLLGSGRTELALALFGMNPIEKGEILLDGKPFPLNSNQHAIKAGIAYLSEDRLTLGLNLRQSIADNIAIPILDRIKDHFGFVPTKRRSALANKWVDQLGIKTSHATDAVQTLSGGNQQRVALAKWLATNPKILILDSPTVGVDILNKRGIYDIIRKLANDGVAILWISDEVSELYFNTDRILHMSRGKIIGEFVPGKDPIEKLLEAIYV